MPLYDYTCRSCGAAAELLRKYERRDDDVPCTCFGIMTRIPSVPHCVPDGMYSYAPNVGSATAFEKRLIAMKNGERVIRKESLTE